MADTTIGVFRLNPDGGGFGGPCVTDFNNIHQSYSSFSLSSNSYTSPAAFNTNIVLRSNASRLFCSLRPRINYSPHAGDDPTFYINSNTSTGMTVQFRWEFRSNGTTLSFYDTYVGGTNIGSGAVSYYPLHSFSMFYTPYIQAKFTGDTISVYAFFRCVSASANGSLSVVNAAAYVNEFF
jgi:hypothetical protein